MARLGRVYEHNRKNNKDANPLSAAKGFSVAPSDIYVVPGFNIRALDLAHVASLRTAYEEGRYVPPILIAVGEDGRLELVDGHHRLQAAIEANVKRLPVNEFEGSDEERIAEAVRSSQGRSLSATERARAYQRMRANGWSDEEIAASVSRSMGDVANHLLLADCGSEVLDMIDNNVVKPTPVMELARKHGVHNVAKALKEAAERKQVEEIKTQGEENAKAVRRGKKPASTGTKKRNTGTTLKAEDLTAAMGFNPDDAMRVVDLVSYLEPVADMDDIKKQFIHGNDDWQSITMRMPLAKLMLLKQLMEKYEPKIPYDKRHASGEPMGDSE